MAGFPQPQHFFATKCVFADFEAMLEGGDFDDYDGVTEDVDEASLIEDKPTEKSKAEDKSEDGNE